jgi:hypothetical protein
MKIIKINVNDIILDHKNISDIINKNCFGKTKRVVGGAYLKSDNLIVWFEPLDCNVETEIQEYVIAQLPDPCESAIIAEVKSRYVYGFTTITFFEINDKVWSLFAKHKNTS